MPTHRYSKRFVLLLDWEDKELAAEAKQIVDKHSGTITVDAKHFAELADCDDESLLTIVGHGDGKVIQISAATKTDPVVILTGPELAMALRRAGLRAVKMITLVSCNAGSGRFASEFHRTLAAWNLRTKVNARLGNTKVFDGKQFSVIPGEAGYWRERVGTKILYYWHNKTQGSTTIFDGYFEKAPGKTDTHYRGPKRDDD